MMHKGLFSTGLGDSIFTVNELIRDGSRIAKARTSNLLNNRIHWSKLPRHFLIPEFPKMSKRNHLMMDRKRHKAMNYHVD